MELSLEGSTNSPLLKMYVPFRQWIVCLRYYVLSVPTSSSSQLELHFALPIGELMLTRRLLCREDLLDWSARKMFRQAQTPEAKFNAEPYGDRIDGFM